MAMSILQSVTGVVGWSGIERQLQDQEFSSNGVNTIGAGILPLFCGQTQIMDFGANAFTRGAYQIRIKQGPAGLTDLARSTPNGPNDTGRPDGSIQLAQIGDTRGAMPAAASPAETIIALRVSATNAFPNTVPATTAVVGAFGLPSMTGQELHIGPIEFASDPVTFRYARMEQLGRQAAANIVYDVDMIAVP